MKTKVIYSLLLTIKMFLFSACGMQLTIPHQPVSKSEIANLTSEGFTHVGEKNILEMQDMKTALGICKGKRNVCGMNAGIRAGFLLSPRGSLL